MDSIFSVLARRLNTIFSSSGGNERPCRHCGRPLSGPTYNGMHRHCAEDQGETFTVESRASAASHTNIYSNR